MGPREALRLKNSEAEKDGRARVERPIKTAQES